MSVCTPKPVSAEDLQWLRERFSYVEIHADGRISLPAECVEDFVRGFQDLLDSREHLERLSLYRQGPRGDLPPDAD